jgi:hypothetical protein
MFVYKWRVKRLNALAPDVGCRFVCVYAVCVRMRARECVCVRAYVREYEHRSERTYECLRTYAYGCLRTYAYGCLRTYAYGCLRTYTYGCLRTYAYEARMSHTCSSYVRTSLPSPTCVHGVEARAYSAPAFRVRTDDIFIFVTNTHAVPPAGHVSAHRAGSRTAAAATIGLLGFRARPDGWRWWAVLSHFLISVFFCLSFSLLNG